MQTNKTNLQTGKKLSNEFLLLALYFLHLLVATFTRTHTTIPHFPKLETWTNKSVTEDASAPAPWGCLLMLFLLKLKLSNYLKWAAVLCTFLSKPQAERSLWCFFFFLFLFQVIKSFQTGTWSRSLFMNNSKIRSWVSLFGFKWCYWKEMKGLFYLRGG